MNVYSKVTTAAKVISVVILFLQSSLASEFREFENTEGKKITAKVVKLDGDHVELFVANGKTYRLATSTLSEKDQAFLKNWKAPVPAVSLDIRTARTSVGGRKRIREPNYKKTEANWAFKVTIKNRRNIGIEQPLTAAYQVFIKHNDRHARKQRGLSRTLKGIAKIPPIGPVESFEFQTTPTLVVSEYKKTYSLGGRLVSEDWSESLHGINLVLYSGTTKVAEYSHGTYKDMGTGISPGEWEKTESDDQKDPDSPKDESDS